MDADYADDLLLLTNAPTQGVFLLNSVEQAVKGIGLFVSVYKTKFMYSKHIKWQVSKSVPEPW